MSLGDMHKSDRTNMKELSKQYEADMNNLVDNLDKKLDALVEVDIKRSVGKSLKEASLEQLLTELIIRGNTFGVVAEAQMLVLQKSQDYNNGAKLTDRT